MSLDGRAELEVLRAANKSRLDRIRATGGQVGGIAEHYTHSLLEELLGADLWRAQLAHERWLSGALDELEPAMARARILNPPQHRPIVKGP